MKKHFIPLFMATFLSVFAGLAWAGPATPMAKSAIKMGAPYKVPHAGTKKEEKTKTIVIPTPPPPTPTPVKPWWQFW